MGSINLGDMLNVGGGQLIGNAIGLITGSLVSLGGEAISAYAEIERLGMSLETFSARELMNAGFADGSVHPISFEIDLELFNLLGHRSDGNSIDVDSL